MKKKKVIKWIKRIILLGIIGVGAYFFLQPKKVEINYRTAEVDSGDIVILVSGAGTVSAKESRKEVSLVTAKVNNVYFEEGDKVKEGAVIARLDDSDYRVQIDSQKNSIAQAQISKENTKRQIENLKIVSSVSGNIKNLAITEGAYVVSNTKVCDILIPSKYEIKLQFLSSFAPRINIGNKAELFLLDSFSYIDGSVSYVGSNKSILETGSSVVDVIITVDDPKYVLDGLKAEATITTNSGTQVTSAGSAYFSNSKETQILSGSTGKVTKLFVKEGQQINVGDIIAELENDDLNDSAQNTDISIQNMQQQLSHTQSKLSDYVIKASISGTITSQPIKKGDWVSAGTIFSTISDLDTFEFKVPVDELDISKVNLDSKVMVTLDALENTKDNPIVGKITKLPLEGVSNGGVTDYYVTVEIPYIEGLLIGMNADADITIKERLNVIRAPIECIDKDEGKYYAELLEENASGDKSTRKVEVEVGIKDSNYYEIVSGVNIGDKLIVPEQGIIGGSFNMF